MNQSTITALRRKAMPCRNIPLFQQPHLFIAKTVLSVLVLTAVSVQKTTAQTISRVAGQMKSACPTAPCGDGGSAIDAYFYSPAGMTIDAGDNLYIAEYSNHAVRKIDKATGIINTIVGTQRSACTTSPCGDGGLATAAKLNGPRGLNVDADGNLYIADFSNHVIRKVDKNTGVITTVAGTIRSSCSTTPCGDGGLATSARLNSPTNVGFDAAGNMYVVDYGNHVIRKVSKQTGIITTVAGTMKSSCNAAPCGDGGLATSAQFNGPSNVVFDSKGNMYLTEYGNHTVRKVDMTTGIVSTFAGNQRASCAAAPCGDGELANSSNARLTSPFSLTIDKNDNIFIADASNAAVRRVDATTKIITTVAGQVKSTCGVAPCGDGGSPTSAQLANPFAVVFYSKSDLYILEYSNQALRKVTFGNTLPLSLINLIAVAKGSQVELRWKTADETKVDRFEIERSLQGTAFLKQSSVAAKGSRGSINDYQWTDVTPGANDNFYRLKIMDKDGSTRYSPVVNAKVEVKAATMQVSPNPVTGNNVHLQFNSLATGQYEVILYSNEGKRVYNDLLVSGGGAVTKNLSLPAGLPRGVYTLYVGNEKEALTKQQIVLQ